MASYDQLFVYKASYQLLLSLYKDLEKLPRDIKFTILQDIKRDTLAVLKNIYRANSTERKSQFIEAAREKTIDIKINIRVLWDLKTISNKTYGRLTEQVESVSKQLTAWKKSAEKKEIENNLQQQQL